MGVQRFYRLFYCTSGELFFKHILYRLVCRWPSTADPFCKNQSQYFTKYCTAEISNGKGSVHSGKLRGVLRKVPPWWRRAPTEGLMLGAGVDEKLVMGLADELQGFSGREVRLCLFVFV